jgi:uncharacterized repeat protein (TIGR01451 family)
MMKTFPPRPHLSKARVFTALLISFVILVTPVTPLVSASAWRAGDVESKLFPLGRAFDPPSVIITATKSDSFSDPDNDGKAEPGDTVTYDVNVSNAGASDATGVTFNDTIDPNTTLVPGSLRVSPLAFADSYNATKDIALSVPAPGVLLNDTGTPAPAAQPIAAGATAHGGAVTLNADGSFTYTPAAGFTGTDTFNYTATNGLSPNDTATVTINIDEAPTVANTSPTNGATNVAQNSNITVNFSEPVNASAASFSVQCPTGSPRTFTLSASPAASFTLDPTADFPAGTTCTVTVFANQITDADTFDPPDQMAADYTFSFGVKPLAVDDMRSATGNVRIDTSVSSYSVLANDQGPGAIINAFDVTSAHGGEVTMNTSTGTFTYDPPRGFTGTDSFNYTISNAAGSDQGTVVLTVSDMIWFINNTPGACASGCEGRLTHPFTSLSAFEAINGNGTTSGGVVIDPEAGDNIFVYTGSSNYTGPLTLENNQRLIGQGATSEIPTITGIAPVPDGDPLPSTGGTAPVIAGSGVTLAQNDQLYGLSFVGTGGAAIQNAANIGTFLMDTVSVNNSSTNTAGIVLNGGGTATATGINTIDSGTATALNVTSTNISATGMTFRSISSSGGSANGIVLDNTGTGAGNGGLVVIGNGGACTSSASCTGGTVSNKIGADGTSQGIGVYANATKGVSLTRMQLNDFSNYAVRGTSVSGFTLNNSHVSGANGDNPAIDEGSIIFDGLTGTSSFSGDSIAGSVEDNFRVRNTSGTSDIFINGCAFTGAPNDNLIVEPSGTATLGAYVTNNTFTGVGGDHFQTITSNSAALNLIFTGNSYSNNFPGSLGGGITISGGNAGSSEHVNFDISNNGTAANPLTGTVQGGAININEGVGNGVWEGQVANNFIGVAAVNGSGASQSSGLRVENHASGTLTAIVSNNTIRQWSTQGISLQAGDTGGNGPLNVTITGNVITNPNPASAGDFGILLNGGTQVGNTNQICLDLKNNNSTGNVSAGGVDYRLRQRMLTTVRLPGYVGANNNNAAVATYVLTRPNTASGSGTVSVANNVAGGGGGFINTPGGAQCAQPTIPTMPIAATFPNASGRDDSYSTASAAAVVLAPYFDRFNVEDAVEVASLNDAAKYANSHRRTDAHVGVSGAYMMPAAYRATARANAESAQERTARNARGIADKAAVAAHATSLAQPISGETVNASVVTLPAGKTVHITFQVTVDNPFGGTNQVSNQGTVSGDNFTSVLTDDPSVGGSSDPTVTPILTPPDITIKDASVAEPASGSAPAAFAVTLSHAFTHTVTVNFATADDTGGANPATVGSDYTTTSGTLTFNPGETVQTISVPVLADADSAETNETFLVNLSGATAGSTITDAQAVGTITPDSTPGTVIISELRTSGPAGADDEFVELLNNTDADITVQASDASAGWALVKSGNDCSATPVVVAVIPAGTLIPARGNYLVVGSAYSLGTYAAGDQTLVFGIEDDHNLALFNTADLANVSTATRLDAVGFGANTGNNCNLLREGATLQPSAGSTSEYSFVRKVDKGATEDTNENAADFVVVSTTPATPVGSNTAPGLGAPGPENSTGERGPVPCNVPGTARFGRSRLDSTVAVGSAPNTIRDATSDPGNNSTFGTIYFRRRFTNNTGGPVTRLRFRITNTKSPATPGAADLRARSSAPVVVSGINDAATCGGSTPCSVTAQGTTLEQPPAQTSGGGVNSTLGVGTITLATPLASGASVNLQLLFGVQQHGDYHLSIVIETVTGGSIGQDVWELRGNTLTGDDTDGGCNTPPVANAGADQTIECGGGSTPVTLDGSASTDADGDALTYEWREGATVLGTGATLNTSLSFGPHTITLKVTDPSGDFSEDTVSVNVVDTTNPLITAPPNVNVNTGPGATSCGVFVSNATLGAATASDGCSASVTVTRTGVPAGNVFPVGTNIVTYTADDGHGHTRSAMQTVTVTDNTPPTISAPANINVNAPANSCSVTLNPGSATANDNCPGVTVAGVRNDSQPLNAPYAVGTTTITWTANDAHGNTASSMQTIKVNDATPPTIVLTSGTITLGPPNHSYHTLTMANLVASVVDSCDPSVDINDVVISQATSDEIENGNGDGNTSNDIVIAPDCKSLQLRAERQGGGDGRVYKIILKVKDSSGNVATAVRQVIVPHSGSSATDSGVHYTVNGCSP